MDLSIVTSCRNKDYGGDAKVGGRVFKSETPFLKRFERCLRGNLGTLDLSGIDYEWIVVDWCSPHVPMHEVPEVAPLLGHRRVQNVVVGPDIGLAEKLTPTDGFFEHFAKNIGIRRAFGRWILILNGDIILQPDLFAETVKRVKWQVDNAYYYRPRWHIDIHPDTGKVLNKVNLADPNCPDACVAANYGGNFLLATRKTLVNVAQGFDETNPVHRTEYWHRSGMDGEILWNMYLKGVMVEHLNGGYEHLFHGKPPEGMSYNQKGYVNKSDWGFTKYDVSTEGNVATIYVRPE